jgi:L-threonylcarbamoyladenylate synthase
VIRLRVDPRAPDPAHLQEAAHAIRRGDLVVIPTDTLYGIAASPFHDAAVRRIFEAKGRSGGQPLPLVAADAAQVFAQVGPLPPIGQRLAARYWPGPLTIVMRAPATLAFDVTAGTGTIGVRGPDHLVTRGLCQVAGTVLTATSANLSGRPPSADPSDAVADLEPYVSLLLDAGTTPGGPPSTVVDVSNGTPRLMRAGAIAWEDIDRWLRAG